MKIDVTKMSDNEVLDKVKEYFTIEEFVDKSTFDKFGQTAWQFIDIRLLKTLLIIRVELGKGMTINNWKWGGGFSQRGLRTNICNIVKKKTDAGRLYLSAHTMGKAVDFDVKGMTAEEVRMWIKDNEVLFPYKLRLEHNMKGKPISWCHIDVFSKSSNPQVYLFDV